MTPLEILRAARERIGVEGPSPSWTAKQAKLSCRTCGGTGKIFTANSWFPADGYRRTQCGICAGSGFSNYHDDPEYVRWQAERRALTGDTNG